MATERKTGVRGYVTDRFEEKLYNIIEDECNDFYVEHDIDDEEIPSELNDELTDACEKLMHIMNEIMVWQLNNDGNGYAALTHKWIDL